MQRTLPRNATGARMKHDVGSVLCAVQRTLPRNATGARMKHDVGIVLCNARERASSMTVAL